MEYFCPICHNELTMQFADCRDFEYGYPGNFSLFKCEACRLYELQPQLDNDKLLESYPEEYHGYNYSEVESKIFNFLQEIRLKKRLDLYRSSVGYGANILDIGCGDGHYLKYFKEKTNWQLSGIEFNPKIAERGIKEGLQIFIGTFENLNFPDNHFDLIIMNHLLEHVPDPIGLLKKAGEKLKPGGSVIGELPNIASWDYFCFGKFWGGLHVPRHLFLFTPRSLALAARRAGFDNCLISYSLNTSHWALSCQNLLQSTCAFKTELHFGRTKYYNFLLAAFIPVNALAMLFRKTSIINFKINK